MIKRTKIALAVALTTTLLGACQQAEQVTTSMPASATVAPGAPGAPSTWASAQKTGIGSSYEAYHQGQYSDKANTGTVSKVWFSIADGVITETMYGLIHQAQIKDMQFVIVGEGFVDIEADDTLSQIEYLHQDEQGRPLSLAYKITNTDKDGKYKIEKHVFTDPAQQSLFMRVNFTALEGSVTPYLTVNPHMDNNGSGDMAKVSKDRLVASDNGTYLSLSADRAFENVSAGFVGQSDGITDLTDGKMDWHYASTGDQAGNVAMTAQLETVTDSVQYDFVMGFGQTDQASLDAVKATQKRGYAQVLAHYNGEGEHIGWEDYLNSLSELPRLTGTTTDNGVLLHASALVLKAQEDKTHAGALIASLSNPWGENVSAEKGHTGYKAVWPRDFYQCAMALLALGDNDTPKVSFEYLEKIQVSDDTPGNQGDNGWFLQKTHVDGEIEWVSVQLDQTAMPIMLGWKLWQKGVLSDADIHNWYTNMLKPAADFLVNGGRAKIDWNDMVIVPPVTQQERWEEQWGYSPSTTAAIIAGLVAAADIAKSVGDAAAADTYLQTADKYSADIEKTMFTTTGTFNDGEATNGQYYLRITRSDDPNDDGKLGDNNGRPGLNEKHILDGGFLELVRYGVRAADDAHIVDTLPELDGAHEHNLRVKYEFEYAGVEGKFPGWRRYGNDGYGEDEVTGGPYAEGGNMTPGQRGRVWPFFTGERGHYELAALKRSGEVSEEQLDALRHTYVKGLEMFANQGLMLPEQVWDGIGDNSQYNYTRGEGTDAATPLAWTHAEYVKLVRSLSDKSVWDGYPIVEQRYQD